MFLNFLLKITSSQNNVYSDYEKIMISILNFFCIMAVCTLSVFGFLVFLKNDPTGPTADAVAILAILAAVIFFRITGNLNIYRITITLFAALYMIYLVASGGRQNTGLFWCYIFPVLTYYLLGYKKATVANMLIIVIYALILFLPGRLLLFTDYALIVKFRFLISNLFVVLFAFILEYARFNANENQIRLIDELKHALDEVEELSELLPICAECKKIRNDEGFWEQVEDYLSKHSKVKFSHGLCKDCIEKLYGKSFLDKKS